MSYDGTIKFDTRMDTDGFQNGANKLGDMIKGLGIFKLLEKAVSMVASSVDKAMGRIDTMEQFNRVMNTMTGNVELTNQALADTKEIVTGTAYGLDVASKSVQNFVARGMEVKEATDTVRAWGDAVAFYGNGSNATFSSVTDALSKMQTKGNVTMEHMEMLLNAGIPAIELYADAMNITASEVTQIMSDGELKASDFIDTLNTAMAIGTEKFPALAGAAKEAGASWSGTFDNMRAAITRGTQSIITAIDDTQESLDRPTMREAITAFGKVFEKTLNLVAKAIPPVVKNIDGLVVTIGSAVVAFTLTKAIYSFCNALTAVRSATLAADAVSGILTITTNKQTIAEAANAAVTKLGTSATQAQIIAEMASHGVITAKTFALGGLSTSMGVATFATTLLSAAVNALTAAFAANHIGFIAVAAAAAVAGIVALLTILTKGNTEYQKQAKEVKALTDAQKELTDAVESSQEAAEKNLATIEDTAKSSLDLAAKLKGLSDNYTKSTADQQRLAACVAKLNKEQEGLNLTYDEETGVLSKTVEEIEEYIEAKQAVGELNAYIERENELLKEQAKLHEDITLIESKQQEIMDQWLDGSISLEERRRRIGELEKIAEDLAVTQQEVSDRIAINNQAIAESDTAAAEVVLANAKAEQEAAQAVAQATEEEMQRRQDAITDFTEAATNMFDAINTKSDVNAKQMLENLQKNREAMENYSANMEGLREKFTRLGLDDAVLEQLANMGTEGIAYVAELAKSSEDELKALAPAYVANVEAANAAGVASYLAGYPDIESATMGVNEAAAAGLEKSAVVVEAEVKTVVVNAKAAASVQVAASDFPSIGSKMMAGIAQGIIAGRSAVVEAAKGAVLAAMEAAKAAAAISTPPSETSRATPRTARSEISRPFTLGIGIEGEGNSIVPQVMDTMRSIQAAEASGLLGQNGLHGVAQQLASTIGAGHAQLAAALPSVGVFAMQAATASPTFQPVSNSQVYNFYQPVETPDETARAIRLQTTYGLAGDSE